MFRGLLTTAVAAVVLALTAAAAQAAPPAAASPTGEASGAAGTLDLRFAVKKVVVRNRKLVAVGTVVGTVHTAEGKQVVREPFSAPIRSISKSTRSLQRATRICDILSLNLAPLRLELLGLIVELDRVVLTIKADSQGGLLGSLLCGLAGRSGITALPLGTAANKLTTAIQKSGTAAMPTISVPIVAQQLPPVPEGHCTILDLTLGPLDLNLLGLMVHLDRVHLRITADPEGGLLGSLLCGLAGGAPPVPAP
jgi:hypothetical protein